MVLAGGILHAGFLLFNFLSWLGSSLQIFEKLPGSLNVHSFAQSFFGLSHLPQQVCNAIYVPFKIKNLLKNCNKNFFMTERTIFNH